MNGLTEAANVGCKICGMNTEIQGCVDAGRSCEIARGVYLELSGVPVYYRRCLRCGFIFTTHFDGWSLEDFRTKIYNEGYAAADPDYADGSRARANAGLTENLLGRLGMRSVLDYGGGDGTLAALLCELGFTAHSWDPVVNEGRAPRPTAGAYELVTAFEVFEHTPTPRATTLQALSFAGRGGRLLFSTLLMDAVPRQATDHPYIAPRNGHLSLHTTASLAALFTGIGWTVRSLSANLHLAER